MWKHQAHLYPQGSGAEAMGCTGWPGQACVPSSWPLRSSLSKKDSWFERVQSFVREYAQRRERKTVVHVASRVSNQPSQRWCTACFLLSPLFFRPGHLPLGWWCPSRKRLLRGMLELDICPRLTPHTRRMMDNGVT